MSAFPDVFFPLFFPKNVNGGAGENVQTEGALTRYCYGPISSDLAHPWAASHSSALPILSLYLFIEEFKRLPSHLNHFFCFIFQ